MSTDKMSAEFEVWRNEQIASLMRTGHVQAARAFRDLGSIHWMAWQSAWTLSRAAIEVELNAWGCEEGFDVVDESDIRHQLESLGLKVKP